MPHACGVLQPALARAVDQSWAAAMHSTHPSSQAAALKPLPRIRRADDAAQAAHPPTFAAALSVHACSHSSSCLCSMDARRLQTGSAAACCRSHSCQQQVPCLRPAQRTQQHPQQQRCCFQQRLRRSLMLPTGS